MMRVYLDNVAVSARVLEDLRAPAEMDALREIEDAHRAGLIKRVTSRESWREQARTQDPGKRERLESARGEVSVVASDHVVQGMWSAVAIDGGTSVVSPLVSDIVDEALFSELKGLGLKDADARHLMYAKANDCVRFVTTDDDFLERRPVLEARCGTVRIVRPSELAQELRGLRRNHEAG